MANILYTVTGYLAIEAALKEKFGTYDVVTNPTGVTTLYLSTSAIVFTCTALSPKVMKFSTAQYYGSFGDAWTSGIIITNEIIFGGNNFGSAPLTYKLVLGDTFLLLNVYNATATNSRLQLIGKLSNSNSICLGCYGSPSYRAALKIYDITTSEELGLFSVLGVIRSNTNAIYKSPLYFSKVIGGAEYEVGGNLSPLLNVYMSSYKTGTIATLNAAGYFLSTSDNYFLGGVGDVMPNSLLVELP